ncbi:MAG: heavy metal transporter [Deltaproteobacteria bacterium CG2_30_63_29]|nr:MAG: heavy metal transporter [Deltaproteobacteria bacterium CG2_30_63_29]PJB42301.1 MAG: heavy metal transporter [Deltaproteobacteria bacterium CG_4_9_14_3_um_filter_63_12]
MAKYTVEGMTCGGCARSVTNAIKAKSADAKVEIDLEAKVVTVDGYTDVNGIKEAVEGAGFDFIGQI